jgi:hypothetical protein
MTKSAVLLALVVSTLALPLPAQASGLTRTYVSQAGSDSNPCTSTLPCRHFASAYAQTAANGIIIALDPGGYGPVNITSSITINGLGWASITAPANGDGIDINAGSTDQVTLLGVISNNTRNAMLLGVNQLKAALSRSVITGNGTGINSSVSAIHSYNDNRVNMNGTDVQGVAIEYDYSIR